MANTIVDISELKLELGLTESPTDVQLAEAAFCLTKAVGAVRRYLKYDPCYAQRTEYYPQGDFRQAARQGVWEVSDTQAYIRYQTEAVSNLLQVIHLPIRSITSLKIDYDGRSGARSGSFPSTSLKTEGSDYWPNYDGKDSSGIKICRDGIIRSVGSWPDTPGSVEITYYAGYNEAEFRGQDSVIDASPIMDAVVDEAVRRFIKLQQRKKKGRLGWTGPIVSENLGDYSYSVDSATLAKLVAGDTDLLSETREKLSEFRRVDMGVM